MAGSAQQPPPPAPAPAPVPPPPAETQAPQAAPAAQPATSKQEMMQAVMRDTSLTPQEKQRKIQEIMAGNAQPSSPASAQPPAPVETPRENEAEPPAETPAQPATSKQALMQAIMRDTSLTPQEKQKRIQEIMAGGAATPAAAAAAEPVAQVEPPQQAQVEDTKQDTSQGEDDDGQGAKRQAVQAIMRDASLTPQEKQRIQQFMANGGQPVDTPTPSVATEEVSPPVEQSPSPPNQESEGDDGQGAKRQAIQMIMRDSSLTPQEKQKKIQEFMASGGRAVESTSVEASTPAPATAPAPAPAESSQSEGDDGQAAKRQAIQEIMKDTSLTPQEKQKKIQEFMASGGRSAPSSSDTPPTAAASIPAPVPSPAPAPASNREAIQAVMRDASLTPQERQQRIQQIMAGGTAAVPPPQTSRGPAQGVGASASMAEDPAAQKVRASGAPVPARAPPPQQPAVSARTDDPAARKMGRASQRSMASRQPAAPPVPSGQDNTPELNQVRNLQSDVLDKTTPAPMPRGPPQVQQRAAPPVQQRAPPPAVNLSTGIGQGPQGGLSPAEILARSASQREAAAAAPAVVPAPLPAPAPRQPPRPTYAGLDYSNDIAGADTGGIQVRYFMLYSTLPFVVVSLL